MVVANMFDAYLAEVEYEVDVPPEYSGSGEAAIRIGISAVGGGTVGEAYADNGWVWGVWRNNKLVLSAADLRSPVASAATHEEMVRTLCSFLAHDGDVIACGGTIEGESYTAAQRAFLGYNNERLWACSTSAYEEQKSAPDHRREITYGWETPSYGE